MSPDEQPRKRIRQALQPFPNVRDVTREPAIPDWVQCEDIRVLENGNNIKRRKRGHRGVVAKPEPATGRLRMTKANSGQERIEE